MKKFTSYIKRAWVLHFLNEIKAAIEKLSAKSVLKIAILLSSCSVLKGTPVQI